MTQPWTHLPNAKHIDRILAHAAKHPEEWPSSRSYGWNEAWDAAKTVADAVNFPPKWDMTAVRAETWRMFTNAVKPSASDDLRNDAWDAVDDAVVALIAWDHAGDLLGLPPDELRAIAKLGVPSALLLLPACQALKHSTKETP